MTKLDLTNVHTKEHGTFVYTNTMVYRYKMDDGHNWIQVEEYPDATVRDQGVGNVLRVPEAMLRAYSNDPDMGDHWGEHHLITQQYADQMIENYPGQRDYWQGVVGQVVDADTDLALQRVMMEVISFHNHGHGNMDYTGIVTGEIDYDTNEVRYTGWGSYNNMRIEKWSIRPKKAE
jgi:hypothetical protein